jgi:hypothetical protein
MKFGGKGCVIAIILLLSSIPIIPEMSAHENPSKIIYVDDDNTMGPWKGTIEHPFQHIQDAIDVSSNGNTVFVFSGAYYENIVIDESINLIGENKNNTWNNNYWGRPRLLPKLILGQIHINFFLIDQFYEYDIPWFNVDWHPAKKINSLGGGL